MDWSPPREDEEAPGGPPQQQDASLPPAPSELQELSFSLLPSLNSSGRRLGRRISHKKSASDTFAFAAGHDFLALLSERPPLEAAGHARHASSGAGLTAGSGELDDQQMAAAEAGAEAASPSQQDAATDPNAAGAAAAATRAGARAAAASRSDPGTAADAAAAAAAPGGGGEGGDTTQTRGNALDPAELDPRKAKRILANRQSAQRSRMKRLQYMTELEGKKDKAEAALRELRSRVDKAQRQHKGLAQEVQDTTAELSTLQEQLSYQQGLQASISSYVQTLQLQMQQQQWGCTQPVNGYQEQQQYAAVYEQGKDGSYAYSAAAAQQYALQPGLQQQPACNGTLASSTGYGQQQQQQEQQHWQAYAQGQAVSEQEYLRQQQQQQQAILQQAQQQACQQQQQQGYGLGYTQQQASAQGHLNGGSGQQQLQLLGGAQDAAALAAAPLGTAQHRRSKSGTAAADEQLPNAAVPLNQQQCQQRISSLASTAAPLAAAAGGAAAAEGAQAQPLLTLAAAQPAGAASGEGVAARRASLSQGSGSVLLHGSVSDAELDSLLGLGVALSPGLGSDQLEPTGSQEIRQLLGDGECGMLLPSDAL